MLMALMLCLLAVIILVPCAILAVQVFAALLPRRPRGMPDVRRPQVAVLVPAHNESLMIAETLRSITAQLASGDRLLVVADNCTDDTARMASAAGAEVAERFNPELRGKIHAVDFGIRYLASAPPEVVLIVDADCCIANDALERLAKTCSQTGRPVQGLYLMAAPAGAALGLRVAEFAWVVKNQVRATGAQRLGLPCQLMGSGMAFPWRFISNVALTGGYIAEDYKLGLDLARSGAPPAFCPEAQVTSQFPSNPEGIAGQRTRWEHGHIALIFGMMPGLLLEAVKTGNWALLSLAIDLAIPPLALLLIMAFVVGGASALFYIATGAAAPLCLSMISLGLLGLSVALSWVRYARHILTWQDLVHAPLYAWRKIPLYHKYFVNRQVEWVRSRRDGE